ncbi:MAG: alternative ribosome rescue aminoacyl-tRNA hydrolase ArfB [Nitrospirota bacterium]|nr:alternative ribosome rescue aminoacyl-tRNA hydrolase ArfB [Nitrospirota bacterium]MDH5585782.1 alternative ribosome rescue aminoacyl-tRNA hydrolase ArfB [Nitrospirota bacterium]
MPIVINATTSIPDAEIQFSATRSTGPGGQNVNKVNSRVILEFDLNLSSTLTSYQKRRIVGALAQRINKQGILRMQAQRHRSQAANRAELLDRFVELLQKALQPMKYRVPTRVPARVRERRLEGKKQRTETKRTRQTPKNFDDA